MGSNDFAIIVKADHDNAATYRNFLKDNDINFKLNKIGVYKIFWSFLGSDAKLNKLRSLVNA